MKKIVLAFLCLLIAATTHAQWRKKKDSADLQSNYIIRDSVLIQTRDGAQVSALIVRKKGISEPLPTILVFTIYARKDDMYRIVEAADHGYIGVMAYSRGKRYSKDPIMPYEHDGDDVYDVIDWIQSQPWSNKKIGMYGGSYNGFTQWAGTKHLHPALKTIVPSASAAPGIDVPMMNNVFMNFPFPWTYYVSNNRFLDDADYERKKWNELDSKWFQLGVAYRQMDSVMQRPPNRIFRKWLDHPAYDAYWQSLIPYKQDFARINIPVLTTTGYYDGGQVGALYYLREHYKYNPNAKHYLLIGPYGHFGAQGFPDSIYNGYRIDPVGNVPIHEIIHQWFDHILRNGPLPAILKDKINYQLMGSNEWKSAGSLQELNKDKLRFYLARNELITEKPRRSEFSEMQVNFQDRTTMNSYYYLFRSIWENLNNGGGVLYKSEPLKEDLEFTGCFSGVMNAVINKKDMDYSAVLFEQMPDGRYFYLTYFMGRASYASNPEKRTLLKPGTKTSIPFSNSYFTSRKLSKGSRLVLIMNVNKSASEQINYGTGKDVSDETIADGAEPLKVKWYNDSYIDIPVQKSR
jgi:putative CocE/NonD family hydrolase